MKILVVCGMGLGSSHFLLMETIALIKKHGIQATIDNTDLFTAQSEDADLFIGADYIVSMIEKPGIKIGLDDILDGYELEAKLLSALEVLHGNLY
ncbi:MAG: PTS sugar transporter subunit IIB [Clostridia bacterium]|nr:PTS sugar transporter subunit IIB [Clostridia bacterium]